MEDDLRNTDDGTSSGTPSNPSPWATVAEAAAHFRRSEWFIRKVANQMSKLGIDRHPIKAGRDWLIDISGMTSFFSSEAVHSSATTQYPIAEFDGSLPGEVGPDETWGWENDVA